MIARLAGIMSASLLAAAIVALPVTAAQAERAQVSKSEVVLDVRSAADSCNAAINAAREWLRKVGRDAGGNAETLRNRIHTAAMSMWDGPTRRAGLKIVKRLNVQCDL
ncbi:hypothetical protein AB0F17_54630 [Nonomuraea sp. NPDC026600]|uniref:hypothetical protein n=1 Tax=Nonomuraea sp. NPDC026600 TaxID=3155363 RepID=UPI0033F0C483